MQHGCIGRKLDPQPPARSARMSGACEYFIITRIIVSFLAVGMCALPPLIVLFWS